MKERIKNFFIAFLIFAGFVFIGSLMIIFLPLWFRCVIWGLMLIWILWDVSKPEKKTQKYWLYVIEYDEKVSQGVISTSKNAFSLPQCHVDRLHDINNISVVEIDKETFDLIMSKK